MPVALCQLEVRPGQPYHNLERARGLLARAVASGARLAVLPEMALPGYLLGDLWERDAFLRECLDAQEQLVRAAGEMGLAVAFGGLAVDFDRNGEDGRPRKYNAFLLAWRGRLIPPAGGPHPFSVKTLLPNYREFDDSRHFFDNRKLARELGRPLAELLNPHRLPDEIGGCAVGGMLCEDGWWEDYGFSPAAVLAQRGAKLLLNLSCSPFTLGKNSKRHRVFNRIAAELALPLVYCNCTGLQNNGKTVYTFDGRSAVYAPGGGLSMEMPAFEEGVALADPFAPARAPGAEVSVGTGTQAGGVLGVSTAVEAEPLLPALLYGTRKFLELTHTQRVVIGASGGIDSALAAALYARVLPAEDLLLLNMPSRHNTALTRGAAKQLADNLGCLYGVAPIEKSVALTEQEFAALEISGAGRSTPLRLTLSAAAQENVQARDRSARLLAAAAAAFGGAFTCNANKSELTVGYTTFYGDLGGFFANLADLWKGQVYAAARALNAEAGRAIIPPESLAVKPSAELNAAQNPEKGGGDPLHYPYHDALFRGWVERWRRASPEENLAWYLAGTLEKELGIEPGLSARLFPQPGAFIADLERWWKNYTGLAVAKRIQAPPVLAVSRRAFGFDHREAQLPPLFTRRYEELKRRALSGGASAPEGARP